jgi:hypothetical protein
MPCEPRASIPTFVHQLTQVERSCWQGWGILHKLPHARGRLHTGAPDAAASGQQISHWLATLGNGKALPRAHLTQQIRQMGLGFVAANGLKGRYTLYRK